LIPCEPRATVKPVLKALGEQGRFNLSEPALNSLLQHAESGDAEAHRRLFAALYDELRLMARRELQRGGQCLSLSATTLLHETYLKLSDRERLTFPDRSRFMAYACRAMRSVVIDYARSHQAQKRGGGFEITSLPTEIPEQKVDHTELERLGEAIDALGELEPTLAQVVDLKFFCGFSLVDIASMRGVSERTIQRDWEKARMILHRALRHADLLS
jgi:RNA polymerase sigma factor (TIGR02999 family)